VLLCATSKQHVYSIAIKQLQQYRAPVMISRAVGFASCCFATSNIVCIVFYSCNLFVVAVRFLLAITFVVAIAVVPLLMLLLFSQCCGIF